MIFSSPEDAAQHLGYQAGWKHDENYSKSYPLPVKHTAFLVARELQIDPKVRDAFVDAYKKGCRARRKAEKSLKVSGGR